MANEPASDVKEEVVELNNTSEESSTEQSDSSDGSEATEESLFSEEDVGAGPESKPEEGGDNEHSKDGEDGDELPKGADKRKMQLNTEIRDKVAERNALKAEIAELNEERYQLSEDVPTVDGLLEQVNPATGDYYTRLEAELAQIRAEREVEKQQKQMDDYTNQIVENNMRLIDESERVLRDFPMFDVDSSEYDENLATEADRLLEQSIIRDENTGRVIGSNLSPYELYSTIAAAAGAAKVKGELSGRKAAQKMMSSADVVGSGVAKTSDDGDDPFLNALMN